MTTTADEEALQRHLDETPDDWTARLVLADLHEERGEDELAYGQRWQAANRKHPQRCLAPMERREGWCFWSRAFPEFDFSEVPEHLHDWMPLDRWLWPTRAEAEKVLASVLAERGGG